MFWTLLGPSTAPVCTRTIQEENPNYAKVALLRKGWPKHALPEKYLKRLCGAKAVAKRTDSSGKVFYRCRACQHFQGGGYQWEPLSV